ncbi:DUF2304 domain-containing protein, partial [Bacillus thuringiensis]|nr:DUF2304 domain-containing protein [Bacillus thuringiensis]
LTQDYALLKQKLNATEPDKD